MKTDKPSVTLTSPILHYWNALFTQFALCALLKYNHWKYTIHTICMICNIEIHDLHNWNALFTLVALFALLKYTICIIEMHYSHYLHYWNTWFPPLNCTIHMCLHYLHYWNTLFALLKCTIHTICTIYTIEIHYLHYWNALFTQFALLKASALGNLGLLRAGGTCWAALGEPPRAAGVHSPLRNWVRTLLGQA